MSGKNSSKMFCVILELTHYFLQYNFGESSPKYLSSKKVTSKNLFLGKKFSAFIIVVYKI